MRILDYLCVTLCIALVLVKIVVIYFFRVDRVDVVSEAIRGTRLNIATEIVEHFVDFVEIIADKNVIIVVIYLCISNGKIYHKKVDYIVHDDGKIEISSADNYEIVDDLVDSFRGEHHVYYSDLEVFDEGAGGNELVTLHN